MQCGVHQLPECITINDGDGGGSLEAKDVFAAAEPRTSNMLMGEAWVASLILGLL